MNESLMLKPDKSMEEMFDDELFAFRSTKQRGSLLEKVYQILKLIKPTSISCEQTFSVSTNIQTKIRSSLSDQTTSDLVYLKYHFIELKRKEKELKLERKQRAVEERAKRAHTDGPKTKKQRTKVENTDDVEIILNMSDEI